MSICVSAYAHACLQRLEVSGSSGIHSQAVMSCSLLVLERKLESSATAAHAPNCWTVVPAQGTGKRKEVLGNFMLSSPWHMSISIINIKEAREKCGRRIKQIHSQTPRGLALLKDSGQGGLWNARGDRSEMKTNLHLDSSLESRVRRKDRRPSSHPLIKFFVRQCVRSVLRENARPQALW